MKTKILLMSAIAIAAASAQAVTIYGLSTRDQLVAFDSATPGTLQQASFITGLAANESLLGIDFRPATGQLYGLGSFGRIYTLNLNTGSTKVFVPSSKDVLDNSKPELSPRQN
jgi:hypothetical protein